MTQATQTLGEKSNTYRNDHTEENGRTNPMRIERRKDWNTRSKSREITDADNAAHQIGRDNTYAQQTRQPVKETRHSDRLKERQEERKTVRKQEEDSTVETVHEKKTFRPFGATTV